MKKRRTFIRGVSFMLSIIMVLSMMVAMTGCGMSDKKTPTETPTPSESVTPSDTATPSTDEQNTEPTTLPTTEPTVEPTIESTVTPEPTPTPTPEVLPTFGELVAATKNRGLDLDSNYYRYIAFGYNATAVVDDNGTSFEKGIIISSEETAYKGSSYTIFDMSISYLGTTEAMYEKSYKLFNTADSTMYDYTYDKENDVWYKTDPYLYIDATEDDETVSASGWNEDNFSNVEITADTEAYYVSAAAVAGTDADLDAMLGELGLTSSNAETIYNFTFDKETKELEEVKVTCTLNDISAEELAEQGIETIEIDDLIMIMRPNSTPIEVPADIVATAISEEEYDETYLYKDGDDLGLGEGTEDEWAEDEEAIHEGWSSYYNSCSDATGTFTMYDLDTYTEIPVTLNSQDGWYFDNQWSFGTYLAVRDNNISTDSPAYEVLYEDSGVQVNYDNFDRAIMHLLNEDWRELTVSDDVVPIVVNDRQAFYLVIDNEYGREIVILQDVGFDTYVGISIETYDIETDILKIVEKFLLNFTYTEN